MTTQPKRKGYRSPKYGHLGVYFLCTAPDPKGPMPGDRLIIVIYNHHNNIVRRLEQEKGKCLDPGYVDFLDTPMCRPAIYEYHIVDIDQDGNKTILATHTSSSETRIWLTKNVPKWIKSTV